MRYAILSTNNHPYSVLLIGIVSGTFSSIFNASMLLLVWETGEWRNWFRRGRSRVLLSGA